MTVIWPGLDLRDVKWSAFKHKAMYDRKWYLRRERFIVYQLATTTLGVAEAIEIHANSQYRRLHSSINSSGVAGASMNFHDLDSSHAVALVACICVASVIQRETLFLTFWPAFVYPPSVVRWKKGLAVFVTALFTAGILQWTVVVSTHSYKISGVDDSTQAELLQRYPSPPHEYIKSTYNIVGTVLLWIGYIFAVWSTYLLFKAANHDAVHGPLNKTSMIDLEDIEDRGSAHGSAHGSGNPSQHSVHSSSAITSAA
ncbi:hypothetical protein PLICRDRAFT_175911 [Plicaturopsis crispa FD-325 SS-3]|nr:hypothetical protein PLICRDRAFT_175911 [Plicaturopsis crispa FD-325 SS-3]